MITSWFVYDVEKRSHKPLHGSMREPYCEVRRYIEALKAANNGSNFILAMEPIITKEILVLQAFFVCFEAEVGFILGYRVCLLVVIRIDENN